MMQRMRLWVGSSGERERERVICAVWLIWMIYLSSVVYYFFCFLTVMMDGCK